MGTIHLWDNQDGDGKAICTGKDGNAGKNESRVNTMNCAMPAYRTTKSSDILLPVAQQKIAGNIHTSHNWSSYG